MKKKKRSARAWPARRPAEDRKRELPGAVAHRNMGDGISRRAGSDNAGSSPQPTSNSPAAAPVDAVRQFNENWAEQHKNILALAGIRQRTPAKQEDQASPDVGRSKTVEDSASNSPSDALASPEASAGGIADSPDPSVNGASDDRRQDEREQKHHAGLAQLRAMYLALRGRTAERDAPRPMASTATSAGSCLAQAEEDATAAPKPAPGAEKVTKPVVSPPARQLANALHASPAVKPDRRRVSLESLRQRAARHRSSRVDSPTPSIASSPRNSHARRQHRHRMEAAKDRERRRRRKEDAALQAQAQQESLAKRKAEFLAERQKRKRKGRPSWQPAALRIGVAEMLARAVSRLFGLHRLGLRDGSRPLRLLRLLLLRMVHPVLPLPLPIPKSKGASMNKRRKRKSGARHGKRLGSA